MKKEKIFFENLDSIRFIAASMVLLNHAIHTSFQYVPQNDYLLQFLYIISSGEGGVSIFFVLSGFLITYLLISEHELAGKVNIKNFYIRRILRIWPLYFGVVIFSFLIYPSIKAAMGIDNPRGSNLFYHIIFLSNFDVINVQTFCRGADSLMQNITWSVSIEEQFYLFWPLIFTFLPKRAWVFAISSTIVVSIIFRIAHYGEDIILHFHSLAALLDLGTGGLLAYLVKESSRVRAFFERCSTREHVIFFIFMLTLLAFSDMLHLNRNLPLRICITLSFALIICSQAITKTDSILNLKNWAFANRWGKYTYGIYLLHPIAILIVDIVARKVGIHHDNFIKAISLGAVSFVLTLVISKLSYTYYESWFLRLKDRFAIIKTHR